MIVSFARIWRVSTLTAVIGHIRRLLTCTAATVVVFAAAQPSAACPKCKVAAGELADESPFPDVPGNEPELATEGAPVSPRAGRGPISVGAGIDFTTAYFYRGYLQQDRGLIAQPFITLSTSFDAPGGWRAAPYLGWWNSLHSDAVDTVRGGHGRHNHNARTEQRLEEYIDPGHPGNPNPHTHTRLVDVFIPGNSGSGKGWYETELMGGITFTRGDWFIDLSYHAHFFPEDTHDFVHEIGAKIAYDLAGFWDDTPHRARKFSLRPWVTVFRELADHNGDENTYIEVGIEPTWRFRCAGRAVAVSLPVLLAGSPDGYYYDSDDDDSTLGYASAAIKASISLPIPKQYGDWYLNGSVTYLKLLADSTEIGNRGDDGEFIGTIGVGVSF